MTGVNRGKLNRWKPYLALLAVYFIWGTTAGAIRLGADSIPSALLPCARFLIAGSLLTGLSLLKGEKLPSASEWKHHLIIGFLLFFAGNSIICWTVKYVTTSFGSILVASTPLWMNLLSAWLPPKEKINPVALLGIVIGFVGMLILLSPQFFHPVKQNGLFWICIAGLAIMTFSWSLGSIYARKHPVQSSLPMSVGLQNILASLMLIPICIWQAPSWPHTPPSWYSLTALLYLIGFGTMIATPCYYYVLKHLPISVSSTFAYVTPVLAVCFGVLFLKEPLSPSMVSGAMVILIGVAIVQWIHQRQSLGRKPDESVLNTLIEVNPTQSVSATVSS